MLVVYLFLGAGAFLALLRVFMVVRRQRSQRNDDWDAQLVRNFRQQGGQGFQPVDISFFFGVPQESQCEPLAVQLRGDGALHGVLRPQDRVRIGRFGPLGERLPAREDQARDPRLRSARRAAGFP